MTNLARNPLKLAGGLSLAVAVFQSVISFSPEWAVYFGAPAQLAANVPVLLVSGLSCAVIFAGFGLYALAGAGSIRPLPFMRLGLVAIGTIYTLRGSMVIPQLLAVAGGVPPDPSTSPAMATPLVSLSVGLAPHMSPAVIPSSLVSLLIGLVYLAGTFGSKEHLKR